MIEQFNEMFVEKVIIALLLPVLPVKHFLFPVYLVEKMLRYLRGRILESLWRERKRNAFTLTEPFFEKKRRLS